MSFLSTVRRLLPSSMDWLITAPQASGPFPSSYDDVCSTRALLKSLNLPTEIVLQILDFTYYWPSYEFRSSDTSSPVTAASKYRNGRSAGAAVILELPLYENSVVASIRRGGEAAKIKKIEFRITSRDQGWTSENTRGTYATSSWSEVSILRDESGSGASPPGPRIANAQVFSPADWKTVRPETPWRFIQRPESALQGPQGGEGDLAWYLQGNQVAAAAQEYRVVWSEEGYEGNEGAGRGEGFIEALRDGDYLVVWARSKVKKSYCAAEKLIGLANTMQYPGWVCVTESIQVTVYYGF